MLDPKDWRRFRELAHAMLDEAIGEIETLRERPVWRPVPLEVREAFATSKLPLEGSPIADVYADFRQLIAPYATGNRHPRFLGWVHGGGTPSGMLAEMLAASLNCNTAGREQAALYVERAVVRWWAEVFGLGEESSGIVASGTTTATIDAMLVARTRALGAGVRREGLEGAKLVGYTGVNAHLCLGRAFDIIGLGTEALRRIPLTKDGRMDEAELERRIHADRAAGLLPFLLAATAGSVDTGAIDDLARLGELARNHGLWYHVDGAFGALAILSPRHRWLLTGIASADSIVFDFHKWLQVPYGAGLFLTPHRGLHLSTFSDNAAYLERKHAGTADGDPWFSDFGIELSRRFRALAVWFTMREFGLERLGRVVAMNCDLAQSLAERIAALPHFELLSTVTLNIVCARYIEEGATAEELDRINDTLAIRLQLGGEVVPSTTRVDGKLALRFNFTNHRATTDDLDRVITALIEVSKTPKEPFMEEPKASYSG